MPQDRPENSLNVTAALPAPTRTPARAGTKVPVLHGSDVVGLSRLAFDATLGVMDLVEAMHHTIASGAWIAGAAPAGRPGGITGLVYGTVRGTTRVLGLGINGLLGALLPPADPRAASAPEREILRAVLCGVWGDHLVDSGNPLAIPTQLRIEGCALDLGRPLDDQVREAKGRLFVLAHGLCMNDLQWLRQGHDHGQALARDLDGSAVYLHYNSGRHVSQNGRDCAALLEQLVARWPVPVDELVLVGHSMGGLVLRSACHIAGGSGLAWPARVKKIAFLGTPHHGAPLERGGRLLDMAFGVSPYVAPFARLGKARSAGITDLRYGNLQDADWQGRCRHTQRHDDRVPTPLPAGVTAYAVAATTAEHAGSMRSTVLGDGLVPIASALGWHRQSALALHLPATRRLVVTQANHWDLLGRADVYAQLRTWLA
jgi:pimeloyl-ACP methyl ester carboxylesterase